MRLARPLDILNKTVGRSGLKIMRGIEYGVHERALLDIYLPADTRVNLPVIVFYYGGSWQWGERGDFAFVAALLARRGFVVVVPDYRLYPDARYPDFLKDGAEALSWVYQMIGHYRGDAGSVFLLGHSAGAYNAVMLALAPDFAGLAARLAGVAGLAGPYDFLPIRDQAIKQIFSPPVDVRQTQPITHARGDAPPLFLATGGQDRVVLPRNTTALAARQRQAGGVVETRIYPNLGHVGLLLALLPYLQWRAPVLQDVLGFIAAARAGDFADAHSETSPRVISERP